MAPFVRAVFLSGERVGEWEEWEWESEGERERARARERERERARKFERDRKVPWVVWGCV